MDSSNKGGWSALPLVLFPHLAARNCQPDRCFRFTPAQPFSAHPITPLSSVRRRSRLHVPLPVSACPPPTPDPTNLRTYRQKQLRSSPYFCRIFSPRFVLGARCAVGLDPGLRLLQGREHRHLAGRVSGCHLSPPGIIFVASGPRNRMSRGCSVGRAARGGGMDGGGAERECEGWWEGLTL